MVLLYNVCDKLASHVQVTHIIHSNGKFIIFCGCLKNEMGRE